MGCLGVYLLVHAHLLVIIGFGADGVWAVVLLVAFSLAVGVDFVDVRLTG